MNNYVLCLFGPSGSGKTTWKNWFIKRGFKPVPSFTTRSQRFIGEKDYIFVTPGKFIGIYSSKSMINANWNYLGHYYGTSKKELETTGPHVIVTDITSLLSISKELKDMGKVPVFICCPLPNDVQEIEKRMLNRNTPERLSVALKEKRQFEELKLNNVEYLYDENCAYRILNKYYEVQI